MRIDSSGNVGIGTTSPSTKLDVLCAPNAGVRVTDGTQVGIMYASGVGGIVAGTTSEHPYILYSNNSERLRIDSSGRVGIGTTSPSSVLSVHANNKTVPAISARYSDAGYKLGFGVYNTLGYPYIALNCNQVASSNNQTYDLAAHATKLDLSLDGQTPGFIFSTASSGTAGGTITWSERMRIDSSGNVGIGVTSIASDYKISVNGTGNFYSSVNQGRITFGDPSDSSGYVGIYRGAAGPSGASTGGNSLNIAGYDAITFNVGASSFGSQTERLRIDSSGNLLVGATSNFSADKMCLNFTSSQNGLGVRDDSNSSGANYAVFRNSSNGIVGTISRVTTTNAVAYNTSSDQRLKSNIADALPVLDKLMDVKVRQFDWTEGNLHQDAWRWRQG